MDGVVGRGIASAVAMMIIYIIVVAVCCGRVYSIIGTVNRRHTFHHDHMIFFFEKDRCASFDLRGALQKMTHNYVIINVDTLIFTLFPLSPLGV